jgi:hypothetical protein
MTRSARAFALAFDAPATLAAVVAGLAASGLPPAYPGRFLADIAALTTRDVNAAYASHLAPGQLTLIALGDASARRGAPGTRWPRPAPGDQRVTTPSSRDRGADGRRGRQHRPRIPPGPGTTGPEYG